MEGLGTVVAIGLFLIFIFFSALCIGEHFTKIIINPNEGWVCTQSMVTSPKAIKPVVEECTQYTWKNN